MEDYMTAPRKKTKTNKLSLIILFIYILLLIACCVGYYKYRNHEAKYILYGLFSMFLIYAFCFKCGLVFK